MNTITNDRVTNGMAHIWARTDGGTACGSISFCACVSLTDITTRISIVAGLAMVALLVIGWRKPAKLRDRTPRSGAVSSGEVVEPVDIPEKAARKTLDAVGLGALSVVMGVAVAIVLSVSIAWLVTTFVSRL